MQYLFLFSRHAIKKIFSKTVTLGTLEFLCALFPYWLCLDMVSHKEQVSLVFQFVQSYHYIWRV